MLLRSILEVSSRRAVRRIPRQFNTQIPSFLRRELSTTPQKNASPGPGSAGKPSKSGGSMKFVVGGAAVGAAVLFAYQTGYVDQILGGKVQHDSLKEAERDHHSEDKLVYPNSEDPKKLTSATEQPEKVETHLDTPQSEALSERQGEPQSQMRDKLDRTPEKGAPDIKMEDISDHSQSETSSVDQIPSSRISPEGSVDTKSTEVSASSGVSEEVQSPPSHTQTSASQEENDIKTVSPSHFTEQDKGEVQSPMSHTQTNASQEENEIKTVPPPRFTAQDKGEDVPARSKGAEQPYSLLKAYNLGADESFLSRQGGNDNKHEAFSNAIEELNDATISKDGKLVVDFLQAIHTAEKRQAEIDAQVYGEEKKALKEKYEKDLKDARLRELMLTEEAAMLDKELKRERAKAAAALKSLQEKLEEKLEIELEKKETEAESKLKKVQELAKAEQTALIAKEKAAQIEKMAEANLHINALCMAFYARSEEARRSHSAHKLALGALALEDALSRGFPIHAELEALRNYLEGIDKDSILDLVLSSLPDETRNKGTYTLLQLNEKFNALKGTLRHYSLIPPGGGGILAHSLAHIACWLKVKVVDQSGDGIESVINIVEGYLAEGKIKEAADALEEGVQGTQAAEIVGDWLRSARNRAITEQALTLLQSYATSISLT